MRVRETAQALGIRTKSILLEILKAETEEEMIQLLEQVSRLGLNRDDLRKQTRTSKTKAGEARKRPYVYTFKAPDKKFSLALKFRQASVTRVELIETIEGILDELRQQRDLS